MSSVPRTAWRRAAPIGLLTAVCGAFVAHALMYPAIYDDAFISYRYAANLAEGHGLVFNPGGERVEGYSNFLWVILLALAHWLGVADLQSIAPGLSLAFGVGVVAMTGILARRLLPDWPWAQLAAVALTAAHGSLACYAVTGMETSSFALLVTAGLVLVAGRGEDPSAKPAFRGDLALALVGALCAMSRPEGPAYAGLLLLLYAASRGWRPGARAGLAFALLYGGYFLWRVRLFGFVLPNTYYAKLGGTGAHLALGRDYAEGFLLSHLGILGILGAGLAARRRLPWGFQALALTALALVMSIYVGGDISPLFRFLVPVIPVGCVATAYLLWSIPSRFADRSRRVVRGGLAVAVVAVVLAAPHVPRLTLFGRPPSAGSDFAELEHNARFTRGYERIAAWMRRELPDDLSIALNAAGVIPYRTGLTAIDMLGLNDVHIAHTDIDLRGAVGHAKHDAGYVLDRQPDVVFIGLPLVLPGPPDRDDLQRIWRQSTLPGDRELVASPGFQERYQVVVVQVAARGFTPLFLRRDRLALLDLE